MPNECAVCYVSDLNFLLPSLVSASQLRKFVPLHKADVFIFTVGVDNAQAREVDRFSTPFGIRVVPMEDHLFSNIDQGELTKTLTPMATFGRFFINQHLPSSCRRLVYIDGDTWVERDPAALIEARVPEGRFAAAEDTIFFRQKFPFGVTTRNTRDYYNRLGLDRKNGYFNAGVFAVSRDTWKTVEQEACAFFLKNREICKYFDQSALNFVVGDRRLHLSNKWNFQTQLRFWRAEQYVTPNIYHFNRYPKPWMAACDPWKEMHKKYQPVLAQFAALNLPLQKLSAEQEAKIDTDNHKMFAYLGLPLVSQIALISMGFKYSEKNAWL